MMGQLQRYQLLYVVLGMSILILTWSPIWLRYFRFGPLEWCWRSLTYWQRQPMRRRSAAPADVYTLGSSPRLRVGSFARSRAHPGDPFGRLRQSRRSFHSQQMTSPQRQSWSRCFPNHRNSVRPNQWKQFPPVL